MKKAGAAHVEMILAFVLFVGFVVFLLNTLQPYKKDILQDSILESLSNKFISSVETNLTKVLVENQTDTCKPNEISGNAIVGNKDGNFFYVYFSPEFPVSSFQNCQGDYKIGYINSQIVLSNKSLEEIKLNYSSDYKNLRKNMGLPTTVDFSVIAGDYTLEKTIPENVQIKTISKREKVLYSNGTLVGKDFIFKIW